MAIVPRPKWSHWIEYESGPPVYAPGTVIQTSHYEHYPQPADEGAPLEFWITEMVNLIRKEHPEATNLKLMRRQQIDFPPAELVRELS